MTSHQGYDVITPAFEERIAWRKSASRDGVELGKSDIQIVVATGMSVKTSRPKARAALWESLWRAGLVLDWITLEERGLPPSVFRVDAPIIELGEPCIK
jgi:hypothetical protein